MRIVNSTIDEINNRFSDETLKPLLSIAHILQQDDIEKNREHIQVVRDLNFYNHLVDFERLEIELDSCKVFRTLCKINDQDDISEIAKIFYQEKAYKDYPQLYVTGGPKRFGKSFGRNILVFLNLNMLI